jgi:hypothetical protein
VFTPDSSAPSSTSGSSSKGGVLQRLWRRIRIRSRTRSPPQSPPPPLPPPLSLAARVAASLLRFCHIGVEWRFSSLDHRSHFPAAVTAAELDALAAIPRLRSLDVQARLDVDSTMLASLLRRPGLSALTSLGCAQGQLDEAALRALVDCCPRLSTLWLEDAGVPGCAEPPLQRLPALTDLSVEGCAYGEHSMDAVSHCASLRRLSFTGVVARSVHFVLLSGAVGATLQHLSVDGLDVRFVDGSWLPAARVDWAAAFANLTALRSLDLEGSHGVDELLPVIGAHCTQLQSLRIRFAWLTSPEVLGSMVPSAAALASLLAALRPLRCVTLSMLPSAVYTSGHPMGMASVAEQWRMVHGGLTAFAALHPQRVTLRLE